MDWLNQCTSNEFRSGGDGTVVTPDSEETLSRSGTTDETTNTSVAVRMTTTEESKRRLSTSWLSLTSEEHGERKAAINDTILIENNAIPSIDSSRRSSTTTSTHDNDNTAIKHASSDASASGASISTTSVLAELPPSVMEPVTVTMECPGEKVGAIIGKKGANVNEIMKRSGCRVVVDNSDLRDGLPKRVILHGPPDRLAVAMALVSVIIKDGANALFPGGTTADGDMFHGGSMHSLTSLSSSAEGGGGISSVGGGGGSSSNDFPYPIPVEGGHVIISETRFPFSKIGTLIGVKGQTIAEVMRRSGCRVHVIQDPPADNSNERQVIYTGTEDQIHHAQSLVSTVLNEGSGSLRPSSLFGMTGDMGSKLTALGMSPNAVKEEDEIEPDKVGIVIGVKGSVISEVMRRSGCKIVINQDFPPGEPHKVIYLGEPEHIENARALIEAVLAHGPAIVTDPNGATSPIVVEEMDIYQSQTGKILGPQGSTIKEIQVRCGVKMSIQVSAGAQAGDHMAINKLRLTGTIEGIQAAVESVCRVLNGGSMHGSGMNSHHNNHNHQLSPRGQGQGQGNGYGRPTGVVVGLGADGTAGILEPPHVLPDGMHQQTAEIKNEVMGKIIGKCSGNITLIKVKSGANVQVMKSSVVDRSGTTRIVILGAPSDVHLATQMVQEVLVNGPAKLLLMPDKQQSVPSHYRGLPLGGGSGSGHGNNHYSNGNFSPRSSASVNAMGGGFGQNNYDLLSSLAGTSSSSSGGDLGIGMNNGNMTSQSMHRNAHSMLLSLDHSGSGPNRTSVGSANGRYLSNSSLLQQSSGNTRNGLLSGSSGSGSGASAGFGLAQPTVIGAYLEPLASQGYSSSNSAMLLAPSMSDHQSMTASASAAAALSAHSFASFQPTSSTTNNGNTSNYSNHSQNNDGVNSYGNGHNGGMSNYPPSQSNPSNAFFLHHHANSANNNANGSNHSQGSNGSSRGLTPQQFYSSTKASLKASDVLSQQQQQQQQQYNATGGTQGQGQGQGQFNDYFSSGTSNGTNNPTTQSSSSLSDPFDIYAEGQNNYQHY